MSNNITAVLSDAYVGLDEVSRELAGAVVAVERNSEVAMIAKGRTVDVPVVGPMVAEDITPGEEQGGSGDFTPTTIPITIDKYRRVTVGWTGEEQAALGQQGSYGRINADRFAQGFRTIVNEMEADVGALAIKACRAVGTAGTAPFATANVLTDTALARKVLEDNGAPQSSLQMVIDTAAMANLRGVQTGLWKVNESGSDQMLRRGLIDGGLHGFALRTTGQAYSHTKGTGTGYLVNNASAAVGDTTIPADTGSGSIVAGDVVAIAGDTNKYVVATALSGGSFTIGAPGLRVAVADAAAITVEGDYTANLAFSRDAIVFANRLPYSPLEGDKALWRQVITDPLTGLVFELSAYPEYRQIKYELAAAWGKEVVKREHLVLLRG